MGMLSKEQLISFLLVFFLAAMYINRDIFPVFREDIAIGMFGLSVVYAIYSVAKKPVHYPLWKGLTATQLIVPVLVAFGAWLLVSSMVLSNFSIESFEFGTQSVVYTPQSVLTTLSASTQYPFTSTNNILDVFIFGFIIPIVETLAIFGFMFAILSKRFLKGREAMVIGIISIAIIMSLLHARAYELNPQLMTTALIFGGISAWLVHYYGELKQALLLHIIVNTTLRLMALGIIIL